SPALRLTCASGIAKVGCTLGNSFHGPPDGRAVRRGGPPRRGWVAGGAQEAGWHPSPPGPRPHLAPRSRKPPLACTRSRAARCGFKCSSACRLWTPMRAWRLVDGLLVGHASSSKRANSWLQFTAGSPSVRHAGSEGGEGVARRV